MSGARRHARRVRAGALAARCLPLALDSSRVLLLDDGVISFSPNQWRTFSHGSRAIATTESCSAGSAAHDSDVDCGRRAHLRAQDKLLHLAGAGLGNRSKYQILRQLEAGQMLAAKRDQFIT